MAGDSSAYRKLFPEKNIPIIMSAILKAGETLQKETVADWENPITIQLFKLLIIDDPFRDGPLNIQLNAWIVSSDNDSNEIEGVPDLLVPTNRGYQVYFAIEAKRLRFNFPSGRFETGNSDYVNDGMMRFVIGQYAPLMVSSAMLGYVFDGKTDKARSGLNIYIKRKEKILKLKPPKRLKRSGILPKKPIDETAHNLGSRSFTLYHIFLPV